jgi:hypothetical protein
MSIGNFINLQDKYQARLSKRTYNAVFKKRKYYFKPVRLILQTPELRSNVSFETPRKCYKTYGTVLISHFKF